jgi:F420-non-reducing hydrogenase small subunit
MKASIVSLTCCAGCVSSLLNFGENLQEMLLNELELVYYPTFIDLREIPNVELAIVEGGVRTVKDQEMIREVRAKSRILVSLGQCATDGGITSLGNVSSARRLIEHAYTGSTLSRLPELEDFMYPLDHFVDVDYYIPGCPPMPFTIVHAIRNIIMGKSPDRHEKVVCTECNRKILASRLDRLYEIYEKEADPDICMVSQGFTCLGSLTRDGCGAPCPRNGFICYGCRGPPDSFLFRSQDVYSFMVRVFSTRTGISEERIRRELHKGPFVFHTFIFSKLARTKAKEKII